MTCAFGLHALAAARSCKCPARSISSLSLNLLQELGPMARMRSLMSAKACAWVGWRKIVYMLESVLHDLASDVLSPTSLKIAVACSRNGMAAYQSFV